MPQVFDIGSLNVPRGEKLWGRFPVAPAPDGSEVSTPVAIIHGLRDGPTVYVGAGTHGDELNGIEAARRLAVRVNPTDVRGVLIVVPIANVLSYLWMQRATGWDGLNANRVFPGTPDGWLTERIVHSLFSNIVKRADIVVDLHGATTGGRCLTHIYTPPSTVEAARRSMELAQAFRPALVIPMAGTTYEGFDLRNSLHVVAGNDGIPTLCVEVGEGSRLEIELVKATIDGVRRVLQFAGVLSSNDQMPSEPSLPEPHVADEVITVRAQQAGLVVNLASLGDMVTGGQELAQVASFPDTVADIRSPVHGLLFRIQTRGVAIPGDRIALIATLRA